MTTTPYYCGQKWSLHRPTTQGQSFWKFSDYWRENQAERHNVTKALHAFFVITQSLTKWCLSEVPKGSSTVCLAGSRNRPRRAGVKCL